ncbi:MAG: uracil-DNA glycosylase [Acidobacteriota bacterium]|nr:uracil-DNA glycosylase [Acidobacteriota bacterium]
MSAKKSSPDAGPGTPPGSEAGTDDLDPLLQYLGDVGYGELYLQSRESAVARPTAGEASSAPAHRQGSGQAARKETGPSTGQPGQTGQSSQSGQAGQLEQAAPPASPTDSSASSSSEPPAEAPTAEAGEAADSGDPVERLRILAQEASTCTRCGLAEGRTHVVFGTGDPQAQLMFIGEGPGYHEDQQGEPFVGAAGQLLNRIIQAIELRREQVYIANIVKCRPPRNRDPKPDEVSACIGYLEQQIRLIRPKVIVALGRVAAQTLLGTDLSLGRMRGQWFDYLGCQLRVTYHPAALLRNQSLKRPTWEDMQVVQTRLRES